MESYVVQKAQQAVEALCEERDLRSRLLSAATEFCYVTSDHLLSSCPKEVADAIIAVKETPNDEELPVFSQRIQTAIELIFEESGRQEIRRGARENLS